MTGHDVFAFGFSCGGTESLLEARRHADQIRRILVRMGTEAV